MSRISLIERPDDFASLLTSSYSSLLLTTPCPLASLHLTSPNSIRKVCPFRIHRKVSSLSVVSNGSKEGLADRWGNIILACKYERIELCINDEASGIHVLHFMAYTSQRVEIFRYIGGNPKKVLQLEKL